MAFFDDYKPQDWSAIISEVMRQAGMTHLEITATGLAAAEASQDGLYVVEIRLWPGRMTFDRIPIEEARAIIAEAAATPGALQPEIYGEDAANHLGPTKH